MNKYIIEARRGIVAGFLRSAEGDGAEDPVLWDRLCQLCTLYMEGAISLVGLYKNARALYRFRKQHREEHGV